MKLRQSKDNDEYAAFMAAPKRTIMSASAIKTGLTTVINGVVHDCYIEPLKPKPKRNRLSNINRPPG